MNKEQFSSILTLIVPQVVQLIVEKNKLDESSAIQYFYNSKVYEALEDMDTSVWHLSPLTLYNMLEEEKTTGNITFPEEAA